MRTPSIATEPSASRAFRIGVVAGGLFLWTCMLTQPGCGDDGTGPSSTMTTTTTTSSGEGGEGGEGGHGGENAGGHGGEGGRGEGGQGGAGGMAQLQILAFNDLHGNLEPPGGSSGRIQEPDGTNVLAGGVAFLASRIDALRAQNPNTVVVSAGDLIGASPLTSALFHDEPTIEAMNLVGLDFNGVGNHEFDQGSSELVRMQTGGCSPVDGCSDGNPFPGASFKFLSANVFVDEATNKTLFPPYGVREVDGVNVAFVGMTLEGTATIVSPLGVSGLSFHDEAETVNALVPELRAQGIEAIVVLLHEGGQPTGSYNECPGISGPVVQIVEAMDPAVDVVVSGHTHQAYTCVINGKLVTSAASYGRLVTDIDLTLDRATGDVVEAQAENVIVRREQPDVVLEDFVSLYKDLAAPLATLPVGNISADLTIIPDAAGQTTLGFVIADAMLEATEGPLLGGAQIAFMNPGGVRASLLYAAAQGEETSGIVTYGEVFTVQPFGNNLVVLTLTGAQLKALLEQQFIPDGNGGFEVSILHPSAGFTYSFSASAPLGARIDASSLRLEGTPIDPAQSYRVTVNSFNASGGDGTTVLLQGTDRVGGALDLDATRAYITAHAPVSPPALDRITLLP
ncbi:bifunctional metallophosphatase/5'-nucleotidase [Chondromyces apiculatus]|uniref:5'-nucleotidase n=1 Tax=Chondromyces apiculatus DSM 436 TaxID=1192034 RepID=A0A017THP4_9BACT|nr:bifunctional metallophosphatase/5'-nucleotidase [Chondromyces apiculatus]EYF08774.1 5'-nucleotidase [Chondromyces apiculatus DSM 436]